MKTSVMEVHDMLSVLSVDGVEKQIGEVAGVESVTVNFAAGNATVRYDETRLDIADIRFSVRQSSYETVEHMPVGAGGSHGNHDALDKSLDTSAPADLPAPAVVNSAPPANAVAPDKLNASAASPVAAASPIAAQPDAEKPVTAPASDEHQHKAADDKI